MDGIFKTAMSGFKKSDVLEFIGSQEDEFKKNEKALKDKIEESDGKIEALNGKIEDQRIKNEDLQSRLTGLEQAIELESAASLQAQQNLLTAQAENDAQRKGLNESERLNEELKLEVQVHKQGIDAKVAEIAIKDAEIERLNNIINSITTTQQRLSRVMVQAQNTADKITDGARKEAVIIIEEAEKKIALMLTDTAKFKNEVETLRTKVDGFTDRLGDVSGELSDYAANIGGAALRQASCAKADAPAAEKQAAPVSADEPKPEKEQRKTGSLFNFSLGNNMFNWDKD